MPGMAVREFTCSLCRRQFTLLSGDLMLPGPNICDECLRVIWDLRDEALEKHVAECLAEHVTKTGEHLDPPSDERAVWNTIVQHIKWHRKQWASAEEAIRDRERDRGL